MFGGVTKGLTTTRSHRLSKSSIGRGKSFPDGHEGLGFCVRQELDVSTISSTTVESSGTNIENTHCRIRSFLTERILHYLKHHFDPVLSGFLVFEIELNNMILPANGEAKLRVYADYQVTEHKPLCGGLRKLRCLSAKKLLVACDRRTVTISLALVGSFS